MIFLIISFLLSTIFICGMEKTPAIPSAEVLYLQVTKLLAGKDLETTLGNYQIILNLLYAHSEWVKIFKHTTPIIDDLETVQDYRNRKDDDGTFHFVRQFTFEFTELNGYLSQEPNNFLDPFTNKIRKGSNSLFAIRYNTNTPQGIATVLSLGQGITRHPPYSLEHYLTAANKLLSSVNDNEVRTIAGIIKAYVLSILFFDHISHTPFVKSPLTREEHIISIYNLISSSLPYIDALYSKTDQLLLLWESTGAKDSYSFVVTTEFKEFNNKVKQILRDFALLEPAYEELYKKLYKELSSKISSAGRKRLAYMPFKQTLSTDFFTEHTNVPNTLPESITYSIPEPLSEIVSPETKIVQKKIPQKKQQKRKRRKKKNQPQRVQKSSTPEVQETSTLPQALKHVSLQEKTAPPTPTEQVPQLVNTLNLKLSYDERVLQWLDPAYQELHQNDVLYHTAPLILEKYILANNITTTRPHATRQNQLDTSYQSAGEIIYSDGTKKTVIFTLTCDPANICYHAGIEPHSADALIGEYFAKSHWEVNFSFLGNMPAKIRKPTREELASLPYIILKEDAFHVRIYDNINKVTLILYKKLSF